ASYTVYSARKSGEAKADYAIKVFAIPRTEVDPESEKQLDPLLTDFERASRDRIELQKQASAESQHVSPVFETGEDENGIWYATRFYPRSINKILSGRVALTRDAFEHIVRSVVQGAVDFKRICGRSHGDIQPSNVQVSKDDLSEAEVVLSDPLPGDASASERFEKADLKAIGQLMYQLVMKRTVDFAWLMLPLDATPEWQQMFGRQAPRWLEICNRLLNPELSLDKVSLESLLVELQPSEKGKKTALAIAACVAVGLIIIGAVVVIGALKSASHRAKERAYKKALEEARVDFNATNLLSALAKAEAALKIKPGGSEATDLQRKAQDEIGRRYAEAMKLGNDALKNSIFEEATNQAAIAMRFKPADSQAQSLLAQGNKQIEQINQLHGQELKCSKESEQARGAETGDDW